MPTTAPPIFGPLPKALLGRWNLFFILLAAVFLTFAWHTKYTEQLDCRLAATTSDNATLTLVAQQQNFDFRLFADQKEIRLAYETDGQQKYLPVYVSALQQAIVAERLEIQLAIKLVTPSAETLTTIRQADKLSLQAEDNRLLEKLVAPITGMIATNSRS